MRTRLRYARLMRCLTEKQLAARLGVAPGTLRNWELGNYTPPLKQAYRLSQELGFSIEDLFFGPPDKDFTGNTIPDSLAGDRTTDVNRKEGV